MLSSPKHKLPSVSNTPNPYTQFNPASAKPSPASPENPISNFFSSSKAKSSNGHRRVTWGDENQEKSNKVIYGIYESKTKEQHGVPGPPPQSVRKPGCWQGIEIGGCNWREGQYSKWVATVAQLRECLKFPRVRSARCRLPCCLD